MSVDFKAKLDQFLNSMLSKGATVTEVDAARAFYVAHPTLIQATAEGVLAQEELSRKIAAVQDIENQLRTNQTQWSSYLERANQTLATAEQSRLEEAKRGAAAEATIKALAQQYNIPEDDIRALYDPTKFSSASSTSNTNPFDPNKRQPSTQPQAPAVNPNSNTVSKDDLVGLINDMGTKDALSARHFALTGKLWDSSKALNFIKEQAQLGRQVNIEEAWRMTENIDSIEAAANEAAKKAERAVIEAEVREQLAKETPNPLDATPQFSETRLSAIFADSANANADSTAKKEVTGHNGRVREQVAALNRLQLARRMGQKSPYETSSAS